MADIRILLTDKTIAQLAVQPERSLLSARGPIEDLGTGV
jgi:hypothetical protein